MGRRAVLDNALPERNDMMEVWIGCSGPGQIKGLRVARYAVTDSRSRRQLSHGVIRINLQPS